MHLKNFSLLEARDSSFTLSPAYDLVSTLLVIKNETEQMSLTINGKKNKLTKKDFDILAKNLSLNDKQRDNVYQSFYKKTDKIKWWIDNSFLPKIQKEKLQNVIIDRIKLFV